MANPAVRATPLWRSRVRTALLVVIGAALPACRAETGPSPSSQPLAEFPYATARPDCAPWDGPAISITLTPTADPPAELTPPYLLVMVYGSHDRLLGRTTVWPGDAEVGSAVWCAAEGDCAVADTGIVRLGQVAGDSVLPGGVRLVFPRGARLDGSFRAVWRPHIPLCG